VLPVLLAMSSGATFRQNAELTALSFFFSYAISRQMCIGTCHWQRRHELQVSVMRVCPKKDKIGAFDLYAPGYRAFRLKISKSVRGVYGSSFGFDPYRLLAPQRTTHVVEL